MFESNLGRLKIRGNRMSSNALLSNFTVLGYVGIFFFSFVSSVHVFKVLKIDVVSVSGRSFT